MAHWQGAQTEGSLEHLSILQDLQERLRTNEMEQVRGLT